MQGHSIDILVKSYNRDFWMLKIALETFKRNVTGYANLHLLIPESEKELFDTRDLPERTLVHYVQEYGNGYLFQQICKLQAFKYSFADYILFGDSDMFWDIPVDVTTLINEGRPEILYTDWSKVGDAICWKKPTEQLMGEKVPWETMRRLPLLYHRSTLVNISDWKPNLEKLIMQSGRCSEFNLIGSYAFKNEQDKYNFVNTDNWHYVRPLAIQCWSHAKKDGNDLEKTEYIRMLETIINSLGIKL